jgi:hypothetical protein
VWQLVEAAGSVVGLRYGTREPYYTVQRRANPSHLNGTLAAIFGVAVATERIWSSSSPWRPIADRLAEPAERVSSESSDSGGDDDGELRDDPEAETEELTLIYRAKGLGQEEAERVAITIMKGREADLDTMAREELGRDPDELGSPWSAALCSLVAFALGAVVVVLPYMFGSGLAALVGAIVLAGLPSSASAPRSAC